MVVHILVSITALRRFYFRLNEEFYLSINIKDNNPNSIKKPANKQYKEGLENENLSSVSYFDDPIRIVFSFELNIAPFYL